MSDVLIACDQDGLIEESNAALCELVGRSEQDLRGTPCRICWPTRKACSAGSCHVPRGRARSGRGRAHLRDAQGLPVPVDMSCTPRHNSTGARSAGCWWAAAG